MNKHVGTIRIRINFHTHTFLVCHGVCVSLCTLCVCLFLIRCCLSSQLEKLHYKAIEADKGEIGILKSKKVIKHNAPGTSLYSVGQVCKFLGYEGLESIGAAIEATFEDWCQQKGYDIADGEVTDEPPPPPTVTRTPRKKGRSARSDNRPRKAIKRAKYEEDDDFTSDAAAEGDVEPDEEDTIMQVATAGPSSSRPNSRAYQRATPTVTIDQEMVAATAQAQPSHDNATQMPHVGRRRQRTPSSRFSRDQLFGSTDLTSTSSVGMDLGVDPSPAALAAAPAPIVIGSGIVAPAASHMNIVNDDIHGHSASAPPPKLFGPSWSSFHPRLNVPRSTSTYGVSYGPQAPFTVGQFGSTLPVSSVPPPLHHVGHTRDPSLLPSGMEFEAAQARDARVWAEVNYANHAPTTAVLNSNPIISMMRSPTSLQYNAQVSARSLMSPTSPIGGIGYPTLSPFQDILSPTNNLPLWHSPSTPQLSTLGGGTGATGPSSFYKRSRLSSPTHSMPSGGVHHSNGSISGPIHLTPSNATLPVGVKEEPFYQHGMQAASSHPSATGLPPQHTLVGSPPSAKQQRHITHANANTMQQQQHQQQRHPYQQSSPQTQHVHITTTTTTMVVSPPGAHSSSSAAATADHLASHAMAHAGDHPHPHPAGLSSSSPPSINMARRRSLSMPCEIAKSSEAGIKALMDLQANWQTNNKL